MTTTILRFFNLLMAGLIAGTLFGISLGYNPITFSVNTYVEFQQASIRALNTLMPALGFITILITVITAFLQKQNKPVFITLLFATAFLISSGLVTRFGNQPINSVVMTWNDTNIPANWTELRDQWWSFHLIRTCTGILGFSLIILSNIRRG